jgi:hypothetical protein
LAGKRSGKALVKLWTFHALILAIHCKERWRGLQQRFGVVYDGFYNGI